MVAHDHFFKASMDLLAVSALAGSLSGYLPPIATVLTIVVCLIHIYEFIKRLTNKH